MDNKRKMAVNIRLKVVPQQEWQNNGGKTLSKECFYIPYTPEGQYSRKQEEHAYPGFKVSYQAVAYNPVYGWNYCVFGNLGFFTIKDMEY